MFKEFLKDIGWGLFYTVGFLGVLALIAGALCPFVSTVADIILKLF